ncbi:MAG: addiction module toxin RelE [Candidatus Diapherotrites archaeon]|uniref:Addiction module toxin RelE n=1 Tax=Candidatus Iainarchaeum sp. TaxID=3101447 RepID=A0A8T4L473_9ARCH|nr:addiction module toxin RelE [Candidatus Diapherotrites archaeon]
MTFSYDLSDELKATIGVLAKKDKVTAEALQKKIKQIVSCDLHTIEHYKNLRYDFSDYKRVHVNRNFVLIFRVFKKEQHILFDRFRHHDDVYKN